MNRKTLFMIIGLMVMALAVVGVGYALWFEDLKIHGDVTTGELDLDFSGPYIYDYFETCDRDPDTALPDCPLKFDTVNCEALFEEGVMGTQVGGNVETDLTDPDWLGITVTGAYPSYTCQVTFDIHNAGTVPVHLFAWYHEDPTMPFPPMPLECASNINGPYTEVEDGVNIAQLHNDGAVWCRVKIHFTNADNLLENATYRFQYHFRACQWNEADMCTDFEYPYPAQ